MTPGESGKEGKVERGNAKQQTSGCNIRIEEIFKRSSEFRRLIGLRRYYSRRVEVILSKLEKREYPIAMALVFGLPVSVWNKLVGAYIGVEAPSDYKVAIKIEGGEIKVESEIQEWFKDAIKDAGSMEDKYKPYAVVAV